MWKKASQLRWVDTTPLGFWSESFILKWPHHQMNTTRHLLFILLSSQASKHFRLKVRSLKRSKSLHFLHCYKNSWCTWGSLKRTRYVNWTSKLFPHEITVSAAATRVCYMIRPRFVCIAQTNLNSQLKWVLTTGSVKSLELRITYLGLIGNGSDWRNRNKNKPITQEFPFP